MRPAATPIPTIDTCLAKIDQISQYDIRLIIQDIQNARVRLSDHFVPDGSIIAVDPTSVQYKFLNDIKEDYIIINNIIKGSASGDINIENIFPGLIKATLDYISVGEIDEAKKSALDKEIKDYLGIDKNFVKYIKQHFDSGDEVPCANIINELYAVLYSAISTQKRDIVLGAIYNVPQETDELQCRKGVFNRFLNSNIEINCGQSEALIDYFQVYKEVMFGNYVEEYKKQLPPGEHVHISQYLVFLLGCAREDEVDMQVSSMIGALDQAGFCHDFTDSFRKQFKKYVEARSVRALSKEIDELKGIYSKIFTGEEEVDFDSKFARKLYETSQKYGFLIADLIVYSGEKATLDLVKLETIIKSRPTQINQDRVSYYDAKTSAILDKGRKRSDKSIDGKQIFSDEIFLELVLPGIEGENSDDFLTSFDFLTAIFFVRNEELPRFSSICHYTASKSKRRNIANMLGYLKERSAGMGLNLSSKISQFEQGVSYYMTEYSKPISNIIRAIDFKSNNFKLFNNILFGAPDSIVNKNVYSSSPQDFVAATLDFITLDSFIRNNNNFGGGRDATLKKVRKYYNIENFCNVLGDRSGEISNNLSDKLITALEIIKSYGDAKHSYAVQEFCVNLIKGSALAKNYDSCNSKIDFITRSKFLDKKDILFKSIIEAVVSNDYEYTSWVISKLDNQEQVIEAIQQRNTNHGSTTSPNNFLSVHSYAMYGGKNNAFKALIDANLDIDSLIRYVEFDANSQLIDYEYVHLEWFLANLKKESETGFETAKDFLKYKITGKLGRDLSTFLSRTQRESIICHIKDPSLIEYLYSELNVPLEKINNYSDTQYGKFISFAILNKNYSAFNKLQELIEKEIRIVGISLGVNGNEISMAIRRVETLNIQDTRFRPAQELLLDIYKRDTQNKISKIGTNYIEVCNSLMVLNNGIEEVFEFDDVLPKIFQRFMITREFVSWFSKQDLGVENIASVSDLTRNLLTLSSQDNKYIKTFDLIFSVTSAQDKQSWLEHTINSDNAEFTVIDYLLYGNNSLITDLEVLDVKGNKFNSKIMFPPEFKFDMVGNGNFLHYILSSQTKEGISFDELKIGLDQLLQECGDLTSKKHLLEQYNIKDDNNQTPWDSFVDICYNKGITQGKILLNHSENTAERLDDNKKILGGLIDIMGLFGNCIFSDNSDLDIKSLNHLSIIFDHLHTNAYDLRYMRDKYPVRQFFQAIYESFTNDDNSVLSEEKTGAIIFHDINKSNSFKELFDKAHDTQNSSHYRVRELVSFIYEEEITKEFKHSKKNIEKVVLENSNPLEVQEEISKSFSNLTDIIDRDKPIITMMLSKDRIELGPLISQVLRIAKESNSLSLDNKKYELCKKIVDDFGYDLEKRDGMFSNIKEGIYVNSGVIKEKVDGYGGFELNINSPCRVTARLYNDVATIRKCEEDLEKQQSDPKRRRTEQDQPFDNADAITRLTQSADRTEGARVVREAEREASSTILGTRSAASALDSDNAKKR